MFCYGLLFIITKLHNVRENNSAQLSAYMIHEKKMYYSHDE